MRIASVDWLRGVAVLCMILWHVVDAWTVPARDPGAFWILGFIGGWAAPLFLLLTGVSIALAGDAQVRRGVDRRTASWNLQKRGWQIFLLAHLFRLQAFFFNVNGSWNTILKPDILNILGLGMIVGAIAWRHATSRARVYAWLIVPSVVIVGVLMPWAKLWWWPTLLHPRLEAYVRPVGNNGVFSICPWLALVLVGVVVGQHLTRGERAFHGLLIAAFGLTIASALMGFLPAAIATSAWIAGIPWLVMQLGLMLMLLVLAWLWTRRWPPAQHSPLVLLGRTSLFVYWVHVELAYGVLSYPLHHALTLPQSLVGYALMTIAMYVLAKRWNNRVRGPIVPAHLRAA